MEDNMPWSLPCLSPHSGAADRSNLEKAVKQGFWGRCEISVDWDVFYGFQYLETVPEHLYGSQPAC